MPLTTRHFLFSALLFATGFPAFRSDAGTTLNADDALAFLEARANAVAEFDYRPLDLFRARYQSGTDYFAAVSRASENSRIAQEYRVDADSSVNQQIIFRGIRWSRLSLNEHIRASAEAIHLTLGAQPDAILAGPSFTTTAVTTSWNASRWNNSTDGPTYTAAYTPGNDVSFTSTTGTTFSFAGMGANINVGNVTVASGVTVNFASAANTYQTGGLVQTINVGSSGTFNFGSQAISAAAGTGFNKTGTGTLIMGAGSTYNGGFTLANGTAVTGGVNSLGSGGALNLNGGILTVNSGTTRDFTGKFGGGISIGGNVQFGDSVNVAAGTGGMTFTNNTALGAATRTITIGGVGTYSLGGIISGTGGGTGLTIDATAGGTGIIVLTGASANTYTGTTSVNAGELDLNKTAATAIAGNLTVGDGTGAANSAIAKLLASDQIANTSALTVNSDGLLSLQTFSDTVGSLSLTGGSVTGTGVLTVASGGSTSVANAGTFSAGLVTGTSGLSLTTSTLTGALTLNGDLTVNSGGGASNLNGGVTINAAESWVNNNSNALTITRSSGTAITYTNLLTLNGGSFTFALTSPASTTGAGGVKITNGSTVTIAGNPNPFGTGTLELNSGTIQTNNTSSRTITNAVSITGNFTFDSLSTGQNIFTGGGTTTGNRTLTANTVTTSFTTAGFTLGGNLTTAGTGALTLSGGLNLGGSGRTITGGATGQTTISGAIDASAAGRTLVLSGDKITLSAITPGATNTVNFDVNASGTVIFDGTSTYAGTTTVSGGTLQVNANNALGTTAAGTTVSNGGALKLNGITYSATEALTLNGTGVSGGGALTNTGTSTYAGAINIASDATISAGGGALTLTGGIAKNGTTLTFGGGGTINVNTNGITGSGANSDLIVSGVTVNENAANDYNGPTFIRNGGILNANVANALPTANGRTKVTMDDTGSGSSQLVLGANQAAASLTGASSSSVNLNANTLTVGTTSGSTTFTGVISGTGGALTKDGASTQALGGANTYTGVTTVNAGTLLINGDQSGATGAVSVNNSGTVLGGTGTIGGAVTLVDSGTILRGGDGTAASGALTLANNVDTSAGIIQIALGAAGTDHSSLIQSGGAWTFSSTQLFNFIDLGATEGTTYLGIITGLSADPMTEGTWMVQNSGWSGSFAWDGTNGINFTLDTLAPVPEPSTWAAGILTVLAVGFTQRRRFVRASARAVQS